MGLQIINEKSEEQKNHLKKIGNTVISLIAIVSILLIIYSYGKQKEKVLLEYVDYTVNQIAQDLVNEIDTTIAFGKSSILNVATSISQIDDSELLNNLEHYIAPLVHNTPFGNIEYIQPDGMNVYNLGGPFDASNRIYYIEGIKGNTGIWNNYHPKTSRETLINFYTPVVKDGQITGVICGYIESTRQIKKLLSKSFFDQPVEGILYDENGMVISTSLDVEFEPDMTLKSLLKKFGNDQKKLKAFTSLLKKDTAGAVRYVDSNGEGRICVKTIPDVNWKVAIIVPASSFQAFFGKDFNYVFKTIFSIFGILLVLLVYLVLGKTFEAKKIRKENTNLEEETKKYKNESKKTNAELIAANNRLERLIEDKNKNLSIVSSLSQSYICIYYVNLQTERFFEIGATNVREIKDRIGENGNARAKFLEMSRYLVSPEFKKGILEFTELTTVADRLEKKNTLEFIFKGIPEVGWCVGEFVASGRDDSGRCTNVLWAVRSIQQQKNEDEKKKKELMEQLNLVNTLSRDYLNVYIINPANNLVRILKLDGYVTQGISSQIKEYQYDTLCSKYINDRVHPEDIELMKNVMDIKNILHNLETTSQYVGIYRIIDQGDVHYYQYKYAKIADTDSIIAGFQNVDVMIFKEKEQQNVLREAFENAQNANAAKSLFLSNMSHDIRTPMNAIIGYSDMIRKGAENPEKVLDYQKKLHKSSLQLLQIINNVLDMARIESGKMYLEETYFCVDNYFEDSLNLFNQRIEQKKLNVTCQQDIVHKHIMLDKVKNDELINNLISNAVKYTPDGGEIKCKVQELQSEKKDFALYEITVEDNGIGISEEFLPMVFESFSREKNTTAGKVAGAGLGMSIVKALVDLMDGTISVESKVGKGTKFTVHLFHKIADESYYAEKKDDSENLKKNFRGKRILLAEDNELNAEIAVDILNEMGLEVDLVEDGEFCVDKIEKSEAGYYDLILMDVLMPKMDGYSATIAIRQLKNEQKATIPIIAMTANAFEEDKKKAFDAGMNGHVAKPIDIKELIKILADNL